jgi:hypothetical protein
VRVLWATWMWVTLLVAVGWGSSSTHLVLQLRWCLLLVYGGCSAMHAHVRSWALLAWVLLSDMCAASRPPGSTFGLVNQSCICLDLMLSGVSLQSLTPW